MFVIGETVVDDEVATASFCCNLSRCKGACCTFPGGRGAPLEDDEALEIAKAFPSAKQFLNASSLRSIESQGLTEGHPGDLATPCIEGRECVFVYFEDGVAKCSFERAFESGLTDWRKPLSCHLFPLRIAHFGKDFIRYEEIDECASGREQGVAKEISLHGFLEEALTRKYGHTWFEKLSQLCNDRKTRA
jgi:hypothetical protein